jgi:hypothetical protein
MARGVKTSDDYLSRVLKHIPSEIVMAYVAIEGVLWTSYDASVPQDRKTLLTLLWIVFGTLTVLTPLWLWRVMRVRRLEQLFVSTLSVPIWLFALGGPFALQDWYQPAFGAIVLPLYTLFVPIITTRSLR